MRRSLMVVLLVLAVSSIAMAQTGRPGTDYATSLKESRCYECHEAGGGSYGPPLPVMYLIHGPIGLELDVGEKATLEVGIENAWVAELQAITATADLSNTPDIVFASPKEGYLQTLTGRVEAAAGLGDVNGRFTDLEFMVEPGTTDLVITLLHDDEAASELSADLDLHLWPTGKDPSKDEPITVNATADGGRQFEVHGAAEVLELGVGVWTAHVAAKPTAADPVSATSHEFTLDVFTDFRDTGEDIQPQGSPDRLLSAAQLPGALTYLSWTIQVQSTPAADTTIPITVVLNSHYAHSGSTSQYDDWLIEKTVELHVVPAPDGDGAIITSSFTEPPPVTAAIPWDTISEIVGYLSATLVIASIYTGGMFGKASRRQLNTVFGTAKRRVAFHNFLSYGIVAAAIAHTIIFLAEPGFEWTRGIIWGGISILAMLGLGLTGALQVPMIRKWNYGLWRWSHFYLAIGTVIFTIVHIFLDGVHFAGLQETLGWSNPFTRA